MFRTFFQARKKNLEKIGKPAFHSSIPIKLNFFLSFSWVHKEKEGEDE